MRKISKISLALFIVISPVSLHSQEIVTGISGNVIAEGYYLKNSSYRKADPVPDTVNLPFIDDFSDSYVKPIQKLWSDNSVFINSTFCIYPPTVGVATLDALQFNGSHYPAAGISPYKADYLTSQPVNLNFTPSDSIYLSFFYQAGGLAEPPEPQDSLILDFFNTSNQTWNKIWWAPEIPSPEKFIRILIKIDQPEYLVKGFRFRFRNYASQLSDPDKFDKRANADHWNIDYIKLDKNRSISDTVLRDVAFIEPVRSIITERLLIN